MKSFSCFLATFDHNEFYEKLFKNKKRWKFSRNSNLEIIIQIEEGNETFNG